MRSNRSAICGVAVASRLLSKERLEVLWSVATAAAVLAILLLAGRALAPAQQPSEKAIVRDLNDQILALGNGDASAPTQVSSVRTRGGRSTRTPGEAPDVSQRAAELISRRAAALERLISQDPAGALSLAFSQTVLSQLASKYPASASSLESHGTWQGPIEYWIYDGADGKTHRSLRRMKYGEDWLEIYFANREAGYRSSDILRVRGVRAGSAIAAIDGSVEGSSLAARTSKLNVVSAASDACPTTGEQRTAVILATFPGVTPSVSAQAVEDIFFGAGGRSLDGYWNEASYGSTWATGDVFGWYTLDQPYSCSNVGGLPAAAMAAANADVNFQDYTHLYFVAPITGCWWSGLTSVFCSNVNTPDGEVTASSTLLVSGYLNSHDTGVSIAAHEAGHTLGLLHARSRDFGAEALGPIGMIGSPAEYGDPFSSMSHSNVGHYSAPHKAETLGWMTEGQNYQVVQSSGVYSVQPLESGPAGIQALKILRDAATNSWLWLEYRQPIGGYDTALPSQVFSGALIHYQDSETTSTGARTDLLDLTPATASWSDPALAAGQQWSDPYSDLVINVESATPSLLTVNVSYGSGPPCTQANPSITITPANPSATPNSSVSYTVAVTNQDSASCASAAFALGSSQPAGWSTSFSSGSLTLGPGESGSVTMTKDVPSGTAAATYSVNATAANGSFAKSALANCTVTSPSGKVSTSTEGSGVVFSDDGLINCPGDCDESYAPGANVTLGAMPDRNWRFDHWEGYCTGTEATCVVDTMGNRNIRAIFARTNGGGGNGGGGNGGGGNGGGNGGPKK